jgi:hypothetical protein
MTECLSNKPSHKLSKVYKTGHRKDVKTATIAGIRAGMITLEVGSTNYGHGWSLWMSPQH